MQRGRPNRSIWLLAASLAAAVPANAHHSIAAIYDSAKRLTLEGSVTEFHFVNPHPFLIVDVPGGGGAPESWRLELDNRWELSEIGITSDTFRPGDRVVVSGSAGRTQPRTLYLLRLDRAHDGLRYEQIGYSPHISTQPNR
ncbi:MAG TPA: DUF6152 family protein [Gammaproteobacteria bacterium]|nr:DUF6152 family protein [Gammaproteobacteria bacterium]